MRGRRLIAIPMLLIVIFLFGFQTIKNDNPDIPSFTDKTGYWIDTTGQVDQETLDTLEAESVSAQKDGFQIVGAFFDKCSNEAEFVTDIGNQNGIGDKEKDNGIVIGVFLGNINSKGESPTIFVAIGEGLEATLNDAKVGRILDEHFVPARADGKWQQGVIDTTKALHQYLQSPDAEEFKSINQDNSPPTWVIILLIFIVLAAIVLGAIFGNSGGGYYGGGFSGGSSGGSSFGGGGSFGGSGAGR